MSVFDFFLSCITNFTNLHVEMQRNARQLMIPVDRDLFVVDINDRNNHKTVIGIHAKLHAHR